MANTYSKKNILIVGGSYGGIWAINQISKKTHTTHRIILIEPHTHYNYLFAFPRFASISGYEHKAFIPWRGLVNDEKLPGSPSVLRGRVIDVKPDRVIVEKTYAEEEEPEEKETVEVNYEYLVLATGTRLVPPANVPTNGKLAGTKWFQEHQAKVRKAERIVLVGAGAVGVQMSADIKDYYPNKTVTLIHSRDRLMNRFHPKLHEIVSTRFEELGVETILSDRVKVPEGGFPNDGSRFDVETMSGRKVPADFVIPTTGMTPNSGYLKNLSPSSILDDPWGFIAIKPTLQIADDRYPYIFAMGDIANTGHQKAALPAYWHSITVSNNLEKLIEAKAKGEDPSKVELESYPSTQKGIHLSLGIHRRVDFEESKEEGGEPTIEWKMDVLENYGIDDVWQRWAPTLTDYYE